MSGGDDPFGRRDRTIIRPNPGGRLPASPAAPAPPPPPPPQPGGAPPISTPRSQVAYPAPPPQPAVARGGRRMDGQPRLAGEPLRRRLRRRAADDPGARVAARVGRPGHGRRQCTDARGGIAAARAGTAARKPVAGRRRDADGSGRAGDPAVRDRRARRRRAVRSSRRREIRAGRDRRRHRAEPSQRRPPYLDALLHAGALLWRAHRRRQILPGARPRQTKPRDQPRPARTDARLSEPRLRRRLSRGGRHGRAARLAARSL